MEVLRRGKQAEAAIPHFPEVVLLKGRVLLVLVLFFAMRPLGLLAQAPKGFHVGGVVHDTTGGVIPGAEVTLRQANGGAPLTQQADGWGSFKFSVPNAGTYTVEVSAPNFAIYRAQAMVSAEAPSASLDVTLKVSGSAETVEVTADSLAAETTSTQLGETLESKKMESVPLNGRNFTDLMAVQPGIVPVNTAQTAAVNDAGDAATPPSGNANPGNLSISGQRETANGFRVNGADVEEDVNMGTSIVPNLDSIESFRVLTSNFDAEYGNSSGGEVLVTTKQGTAQWHGSAFEFLRNTALDARNYFSPDRAAYRQNQYGATVGGPVFRTSVRWFGDYQGTRLTEGIDTGDISVPSLAERGGSFVNPASGASMLTGCVSGPYLAAQLSQGLGANVQANDPYSPQSAGCASGCRRFFPRARFRNLSGRRPQNICWPRFRSPTRARRCLRPRTRQKQSATTREGCARTGAAARALSRAITSWTNTRWITPIPRERAAPTCRASTQRRTGGRSSRAFNTR